MQYGLVALQYEEASNYSILPKYFLFNFTLWMPMPWMPRGRRPVRLPSARPGHKHSSGSKWQKDQSVEVFYCEKFLKAL